MSEMQSVILNMLYMNFLMGLTEPPLTGNNTENESLAQACYTVYNDEVCFPLATPWINGSRPLAKAPSSPEDIGTVFYMYSRNNFSFPMILDPGTTFSLMNTLINRNKSIKIIAHGYLSSSRAIWIKRMLGEFLRADEENVIVVDWNKGAHPPYVQAVANIRMVGVQLAYLIFSLIRYADVAPSSFHLIGHSLGAHLVAHCGNYLKDIYGILLPRITGLDPAGPLFVDRHPVTRLDPSDAQFVDVIHTDNSPLFGFPLTLGMTQPVGHLDFYPNGGGAQPECNGDLRCQHYRASKLFTESIRQSCTFIGILCTSYEAFLQGVCWGCQNDSCSPMGMKAKPLQNTTTKGKFFLITNGDSPFCGSHYRVTIKSSNETTAWEHGGEFAVIGIEFKGARDSTGEILLSEKSIFHKTGTIYRRVILATDVGELLSVNLSLHYPGSILNPMSWRIKGPSLYLHSVTVEQLQREKRWRYCFPNSHLTLNMKYELTKENLC